MGDNRLARPPTWTADCSNLERDGGSPASTPNSAEQWRADPRQVRRRVRAGYAESVLIEGDKVICPRRRESVVALKKSMRLAWASPPSETAPVTAPPRLRRPRIPDLPTDRLEDSRHRAPRQILWSHPTNRYNVHATTPSSERRGSTAERISQRRLPPRLRSTTSDHRRDAEVDRKSSTTRTAACLVAAHLRLRRRGAVSRSTSRPGRPSTRANGMPRAACLVTDALLLTENGLMAF